eukprot:COSAG01_NODE_2048_length_8556_cov_27.174509_1_plen_170_part_00
MAPQSPNTWRSWPLAGAWSRRTPGSTHTTGVGEHLECTHTHTHTYTHTHTHTRHVDVTQMSHTRHSYCTRTHTHTQKKHTHTERLTKHGGWQPPRRQHRPGRAKRWLCEHDDLLDDGELVELATAPPVGVQSVVDVEPPLVLFPVRDPSVLVPVRDISTSLQCRKRACR